MQEFELGTYRHYSGKEYKVIGVSSHSEDPDMKFVVYRANYGERRLWVRPFEMFTETVMHNGKETLRFKWIGPPERRWKVLRAGNNLEFVIANTLVVNPGVGTLTFYDHAHEEVKCYAPGAWLTYEPWPLSKEVG